MVVAKDKIDWSVLRNSFLLLCFCLFGCGPLVGVSYSFSSEMEKQLLQNKNTFQAVSRRYLDVDQEIALLNDYYPIFLELYNQGVIGKERRLDWIEILKKSNEIIQFPSFSYAIKSQRQYVPKYPLTYDGYQLLVSEMELNIGLLHEGDFFHLLNVFDENTENIYTFSECLFRQNGNRVQFEKEHANIYANCTLQWITINIEDGMIDI